MKSARWSVSAVLLVLHGRDLACFFCVAGLLPISCAAVVVFIDTTTITWRLNNDLVGLARETLRFGANQRGRYELTLTILEAKDIPLREVQGVLEGLE